MNGAFKDGLASAEPTPSHSADWSVPTHISSFGFIAALLASVIVFWTPLEELLKLSENSEYSYIPLIPAMSSFLIFVRKSYIIKNARPSAWIGSSMVVGGILLQFSSAMFKVSWISSLQLTAFAIVSTWNGLFALFFGIHAMRKAMLPLSLLLFMIPPPQSVMNALIEFLQRESALASYYLFRMIGIPAAREGMVIFLPGLDIDVEPQCSGIRSGISLLVLVLAGGDLYLRSRWNKALLVATLVPLAILKNAIRIVTLSTLALYVNRGFLNSRLHRQGGILFFLLAATMLIPIVAVMRRYEAKEQRGTSS